MLLKSNAKINFYLDITGKDPVDRYHFIDSLFQEINLADEIELDQIDAPEDQILFENVLVEGHSTVHKAVRLFREKSKTSSHYRIKIKKVIPMGAGLGGGSSNAACVLKNLAEIHSLNPMDFLDIGAKVGSDVPFFFYGGLCRVSGKGEIIEPLAKKLENIVFLVVYPNIHISTAWAYSLIKDYSIHGDMKQILNYSTFNIDFLSKIVYNKFQSFVFKGNSDLQKTKVILDKAIASKLSFMSGSGSSLVYVYEKEEPAISDREVLLKRFGYTSFVCDPFYRK